MSEDQHSTLSSFAVDSSCIGCGTCWVSSPDLFREIEIDGDYKAAPVTTQVKDPGVLRTVAEACPSMSIQLIDGNGEILYPRPEDRAQRDARGAW